MISDTPAPTLQDTSKISTYQIFALIALALVNMQDGFDILAISFAANAIQESWGITRSALGIVFSAGLFGMMIGAMVISPFADKYGRKPVTIFGLFMSGSGMLIAMSAPSIEILVIGRVLTGLGVGGILASLNTLVAEYAGLKYRSLAVAVFQLGFTLGAFLSGFLAAWLLGIGSWRHVFAFGAMTSFVFIPIIMILPESMEFIAKKGGPDALSNINKIRKKFGQAALDALPKTSEAAANPQKSGNVMSLFTPRYALRTALIWASFFTLLMLLYFLLTWTPKILIEMGFNEAQGNRGGRMINLAGAGGIALIGLLSFKMKPSIVTSVYLIILAVALFLLGMVPADFAIVLGFIIVLGFLLHGLMIGLYSTVPALYPAELRATGTGWAIGLSRFGAVLGPIVAGVLLDKGWSPQSLFQAFASLGVIASIMTFFLWREQNRHQEHVAVNL